MQSHRSLSNITRELLAAHNLYPKKRLGQNFLIDPAVLERIINAAELSSADTVLEIGMGLGVLTEELAKKAKAVIALEVDPDMILICKKVLQAYSNLQIVRKSFLEWDLPSYLESFKIVGNLPYYITTPTIERIIEEFNEKVSLAVLTIQKEVAERIVSPPGSKVFGSISVFVQNLAAVRIDSLISKYSFYPQPEVSSAILVLKPYTSPKYQINQELVRAAFSQRRKTIRNSLAGYNIDWDKTGIDPRRRAETLSLAEFEKISQKSA
ncbi:16S rRNA (adenine(1518)-N(6)/adenine(1519)-N(6))-dimethyltransferase RsmA [Candidatus Margulisiibacteriota bacterium]